MKQAEKNTEGQMTLEEAFGKLEEIAERLESEQITLEDSFLVYNEGMQLLKYCNDKIDTVEKKVLQLNGEGELHEF